MKEFAQKLLSTPNAIIVDTETSGLGSTAEIVQLSIIGIDGRVLFNHLIRPAKASIELGASRVTGITDDMVKDLPTLDAYAEELLPLRGRMAIAYNADFDKRMVEQSIKANESYKLAYVFDSWDWVDVMVPYADFWGEWDRYHRNNRWQKLTDACRQQGIVVKNAHDALGDVYMTLALIKKMAGVKPND